MLQDNNIVGNKNRSPIPHRPLGAMVACGPPKTEVASSSLVAVVPNTFLAFFTPFLVT